MDPYMSQTPSPSAAMPCFSSGGQPALSAFPPAMAYVPMQQWQQTYDLGMGFSRGTIFPELDFPFMMGRCQ